MSVRGTLVRFEKLDFSRDDLNRVNKIYYHFALDCLRMKGSSVSRKMQMAKWFYDSLSSCINFNPESLKKKSVLILECFIY